MRIATHQEPVWRDRADYIIRVDLADHGMPGSAEQMWTRATSDGMYEICCIPFFTYGIALGDVVTWDGDSGDASVVRPGGHRVIRAVFADRDVAEAEHERLHGALVAAGLPVEFSGSGYCAIDAEDEESVRAALTAIEPFQEAHGVSWEWGS